MRESSRERAALAEFELGQAVLEQPAWSRAWYGLGEARLLLARLGGMPKEGPLQPLGMSLEAGAGHAFVRALQLDSTLSRAVNALALAPLPREEAAQLQLRRDMLRQRRNQLNPGSYWNVAQLERVTGDRDSSAWMFARVLDHGQADSASTLLELARELYAAGRPDQGRAALMDGAALTTTYSGAIRYREELQWVAEPGELASWDSTAVEMRRKWLGRFWAVRDVRDGLLPGERLEEHYRRYEEAITEFRLTIARRGRSRARSVALVGDVMSLENGDAVGRGGVSSRSGFFSSTAVGSSIEQMERERTAVAGYAETVGGQSVGIVADPFQDVLDDRGVIWIRHGPPTERTHTSGGTVMEAWRYARVPGPDLVLFFAETDFDGHAGASVLIPTPAGASGLAINQLCGNAQGMCNDLLRFSQPEGVMNVGVSARLPGGGGSRADHPGIPAEQLSGLRQLGVDQIERALQTDLAAVSFPQPLEAVVQLFGVLHAENGPRILAVVALRGRDIRPLPSRGGAKQSHYAVRFRIAALDPATPEPVVIDTTRVFVLDKPIGDREYLTASLELELDPGDYQATLLLTQGEGRGVRARLSGIHVPGVGAHLEISSIVLGREGSGAAWNSGGRVVPLHPLNAFPRDSEAELYYQLNGLEPGQEYSTRVELFPADQAESDAALAMSFTDEPRERFTETQRSIGLRNLDPGRYRLRVTVTGAGRTVSEEGWLAVVKGER